MRYGGRIQEDDVGMTITPVTVAFENFARIESERMFAGIAASAGSSNVWNHFRVPTPVDEQTVIRMNRDTLYSAAIIDVSAGATITIAGALVGTTPARVRVTRGTTAREVRIALPGYRTMPLEAPPDEDRVLVGTLVPVTRPPSRATAPTASAPPKVRRFD
jgi:hypothetical protein